MHHEFFSVRRSHCHKVFGPERLDALFRVHAAGVCTASSLESIKSLRRNAHTAVLKGTGCEAPATSSMSVRVHVLLSS